MLSTSLTAEELEDTLEIIAEADLETAREIAVDKGIDAPGATLAELQVLLRAKLCGVAESPKPEEVAVAVAPLGALGQPPQGAQQFPSGGAAGVPAPTPTPLEQLLAIGFPPAAVASAAASARPSRRWSRNRTRLSRSRSPSSRRELPAAPSLPANSDRHTTRQGCRGGDLRDWKHPDRPNPRLLHQEDHPVEAGGPAVPPAAAG